MRERKHLQRQMKMRGREEPAEKSAKAGKSPKRFGFNQATRQGLVGMAHNTRTSFPLCPFPLSLTAPTDIDQPPDTF